MKTNNDNIWDLRNYVCLLVIEQNYYKSILTLSRIVWRSAGFGTESIDLLRKQTFCLDSLCMTIFYVKKEFKC